MKPIEKGCQAIIINSKAGSDGKVVIVGDYLGVVGNFKYNNHWEIDISIPSTFGNPSNHISEYKLMRIDGYKQEETKAKELAILTINIDGVE